MRADSGFYAHALVAVCRAMDVRYSITIRQHQSLRNCQGRRENMPLGRSKTVPPGWCLTAPAWTVGGPPRLDAVAGLGIGGTLNGIRPIRR